VSTDNHESPNPMSLGMHCPAVPASMWRLFLKVHHRCVLIVLSMIFTSSPSLVLADEPLFPPLAFLPKNRELNAIVDEHLTLQLKAIKKPSLWAISQRDHTAQALRFLWLAANEEPICVQIVKSGETISLNVAQHDGSPGFTAGKATVNKNLNLSIKEWEKLVDLVDKSAFWASPTEVKESRGIADGDGIVIEGVREGKYHVVNRAGSTTGERYKSLCRTMLELAKSDMIKAWDRWRQRERNLPNYRPEPSQTEDLGEDPKE
jgi:hypothetical protein